MAKVQGEPPPGHLGAAKFTRTGVILYVRRYSECVAFYRDLLALPILFENAELACFRFGESYLMVEIDDQDPPGDRGEVPVSCLRMNVPNVREQTESLRGLGIEVDYQEHDWGTVAKFFDPEGNLCAFKDDRTFERQVEEGSGV